MSRILAPTASTPERKPDSRTAARLREVLAGRRGSFSPLLFVGPAVIASIAYVDPGNYATNIQAGARYGYTLLWVVVAANLIAMLFQGLSARMGIATGKNLAELSRDHLPRTLVWAMWIIAEIAAMATDLAEFLGGALGFALMLGLPLVWGMVVTAIVTYALLVLGGRGFRPMELMIGAFIVVISLCYLIELFVAPVDWAAAGRGAVMPGLPDLDALMIAVGIIGATIMPHAIYLHSGLAAGRLPDTTPIEKRKLLRYSNLEVIGALGLAGLVNMAMVIMAAAAFHQGHPDVVEIQSAYHTLTPLLGGLAAGAFLISLIASGISSSVVGTMAGQLVMQGFVRRRIPIWLRRLVTMLPAIAVVASGTDATRALVLSQVVLSLSLPVPMLALLWFVSRQQVMGEFTIRWPTRIVAGAGAVLIMTLNVVLLAETFRAPVSGFGG